MPSNPLVIFRNITNLSDARYAATLFAHAVSFNPDKSSADYIDSATISGICQWLSGPKKLLDVNSLKTEETIDLIAGLSMDGIITSNPELYEQISLRGLDVIWDAVAEKLETSWPQIVYELQQAEPQNCFIHLQNPDQVSPEIILASPVKGISLSGSPESELGMKDYSLWNEFFDHINEH